MNNILTIGRQMVAQRRRPPGLESPWRRAWGRFRRHRLGVLGLFVFATLVLLSVLAPWVTRYDPISISLRHRNMPPSTLHWLGTDELGRDMWARIVYGGRVSLSIAGASVALAGVLGVLVGAISGFAGGKVDMVLMRLTDVVMCLPSLIMSMVLLTLLGPRFTTIIIAISFPSWPPIARLVRGQLLSLKERDFVIAAKAIGVSTPRIIFRHLLPQAFSPVIVAATLNMAQAIILEGSLSFLGIGLPPPTPSWGNMLQAAQSIQVLESFPWRWVPPGVAIVLSVLSINAVGDALRDALDPHTTKWL